jgi:hypothetical protein
MTLSSSTGPAVASSNNPSEQEKMEEGASSNSNTPSEQEPMDVVQSKPIFWEGDEMTDDFWDVTHGTPYVVMISSDKIASALGVNIMTEFKGGVQSILPVKNSNGLETTVVYIPFEYVGLMSEINCGNTPELEKLFKDLVSCEGIGITISMGRASLFNNFRNLTNSLFKIYRLTSGENTDFSHIKEALKFLRDKKDVIATYFNTSEDFPQASGLMGQENLIDTIFYSFGFYDYEITNVKSSTSSSLTASSSGPPERVLSLPETETIIGKIIGNLEIALKCFGNYFKSVKEYMDKNRDRLRNEIRNAHDPSSLHEPTFPEWTTMIYSSVAYYDNCFDLYKVQLDPYYIIQKYINVSTIEEMCAELDVDYGHDFKHFNEIQYIGNIVSKVLQKDDTKLRTIIKDIKSDSSTEEADANQNNSSEEAQVETEAQSKSEPKEMLPPASKRRASTIRPKYSDQDADEEQEPEPQKAAKPTHYDEKQFSKNLLINLGYMAAAEYYGKNQEDEMRLSFTLNPKEDEMFKEVNPAGRSLSNKSSWRAIGQEDTWISIDYVRGKPWNYQTKVVLSSNGFDDIEEFKQYIKLNDIGTEIRTVATAADLAAPSGCLYKNVGKISESHKFFTIKTAQGQPDDTYIFIIVTYNLNPDAENTLEIEGEKCLRDNAPENIFFTPTELLDASNKLELYRKEHLFSSSFELLPKLISKLNTIGKSLLEKAKTPNIQQRIMERLSSALKRENIFKQSDDELSLQIDQLFKEIQQQNNVINSLTKKDSKGIPTGEPLDRKKGERDKQLKILKQICVDNFKKLIEYIKTAYINLLSSGSTINVDVIDNLFIILDLLNETLNNDTKSKNELIKQLVKKLKTSKRCGITSFGSLNFQPSPPISPDLLPSSNVAAAGVYSLQDVQAAQSLVELGNQKRTADAISTNEDIRLPFDLVPKKIVKPKNPLSTSLFGRPPTSAPTFANTSASTFPGSASTFPGSAPTFANTSASTFPAKTAAPKNFVFGKTSSIQPAMDVQPAMQPSNKLNDDQFDAIKRGAINKINENGKLSTFGIKTATIELGVNTLFDNKQWEKYINESLARSNTQQTIQTLINSTATKVEDILTKKKGGKTKKHYKKKYVKYTKKYIKNNNKSRKYKTVKQSKQTRHKM